MPLRDDLLRAQQYGTTTYYSALQKTSVYQREYSKIHTDHESGLWTALESFLPKFDTAKFKEMRRKYQEKYGTAINVPGFEDIIHIGTMAKITDREMAAHRTANKYKVPSPLTQDQLRTLATKKARFLRALASPTPTWIKNIGAVATAIDNVEDGLVTLAVLGKTASLLTKKLWKKTIPGVGWVYLGSDILNLFNILSWATFGANANKRLLEDLMEKNPFHKKAKAIRAMKLKRKWPTFGEAIEIAQTCDQLFGYGLCLGGLVGMLTDTFTRATEYLKFSWNPSGYGYIPQNPNDPRSIAALEKVRDDLFSKLATDWTSLKARMVDIAGAAKTQDQYLRRLLEANVAKAGNWIKDSAIYWWNQFTQYRPGDYDIFSSTLMGSMIASTGSSNLSREDQINTYISAASAISPIAELWLKADPLTQFKDIRNYKFTPPTPKDAGTIATLQELTENWKDTIKWPFIDAKEATAEEIYFTYAHRIKDEFLKFSLTHKNDYGAAVAASQVTDLVLTVLKTFADDGQIKEGRSEYVNAAINMAREHLLIPPDTSDDTLTKFNAWMETYVKKNAKAPSAEEIRKKGTELDIEWMETFPRRAFKTAYELFPQWQALQDQLGDFYVPD